MMTKTTRNLCAGAYVERDFRRQVLRQVYDRPGRLLAPSYGFDAVPVLLHCRRAQLWLTIRDLATCLILLLAFLADGLRVAGFAVVLIAGWGVLVGVALIVLEVLGMDRQLRSAVRGEALVIGFGLLAVAALVPVLFPQVRDAVGLSNLNGRTLGGLDLGNLGVGGAGEPARVTAPVLVVVLALYAVAAAHALGRQLVLDGLSRREDAGPRRPLWGRLADVADQQRGNVTLYTGPRPFIGAGLNLRTWSFAQLLVREPGPGRLLGRHTEMRTAGEPDREFAELPFTAEDLVVALRQRLGSLAGGERPEAALPGLLLEDRVFRSAEESPGPAWSMPPTQLREILTNPTDEARHYLTCQVSAWGGEVVTTVFVHVALQGSTLYLEFSAWMLPPTRPPFHVLADLGGGTTAGRRTRALGHALARLPATVLAAPFGVLDRLLWAARTVVRVAARILLNTNDFGTRVSIREMAAVDVPKIIDDGTPGYVLESYVQSHDAAKYSKILERQLIAAVLDFLEDRGVDTSEYRQRATAILNFGVMQFGGRMRITDSEIG